MTVQHGPEVGARRPVHPLVKEGFSRAADAYERGRPDYPPAVISLLADVLRIGRLAGGAPSTMLDLGAGTGKMTRLLAGAGARLIALEPVEEMRRKLLSATPGVEVLDGVAEAIPLADASVDGAVAAQSFHWFHGDLALPEIHRVLRPGGRLCLVWNVRDERVNWVACISAILDRYGRDAPRHRTGAWRGAFAGTRLFSSLGEREVAHQQDLDIGGLLGRVTSISYIAALPEEAQSAVLDEVRLLTETHPDLAGRGAFVFPYRTLVASYERR